MKHSKIKALSLMGGVPRKLVTLSLTLIMTLAMTISSFADVEITKDWNDDLTGGSAKGRSVPTVEISGEASYEKLLNMFYPVGSTYETKTSLDPNTAWGGTWTRETIKNDFVVEEGSSGIWQYRKWSSGVAECWGTTTLNNSGTTEVKHTINLPITFLTSPAYIVTTSLNDVSAGYQGPVYDGIGIVTLNTNSFIGNFKTGSIGASSVHTAYFHVKGYWKTYSAPDTIYRWTRTA